MLLIGITGSIGSGKSLLAEIYESEGYRIINMDILARLVMIENKYVIEKLKKEFGEETYIEGQLNRDLISEIVFDREDEKMLNQLNRIVHPQVIEDLSKMIEILEKSNPDLVFVENALIFEMGIDEGFDYIINVHCDEEIAFHRVNKRRNLSRERFDRIRQRQISPEEKRRHSDFTLNNNGSKDDLIKAAMNLLDILKVLPEKDYKTLLKDETDDIDLKKN